MNDDGKTAASAASLSEAALVNLAFETISELEDHMVAIGDYARALGLIASTIDDDSGLSSALSRLTGDIERHSGAVEEAHRRLFYALHPRRCDLEFRTLGEVEDPAGDAGGRHV